MRAGAAYTWGPLVLAYDEGRTRACPAAAFPVGLRGTPTLLRYPDPGLPLTFKAKVRSGEDGAPQPAIFVPFAEAGADGSRYRVWLREPGAPLPANASLFAFAVESRSREGNLAGEIGDGDPASAVVTFDGRAAAEDWFALTLERPVMLRRVVFAHGQTFHDGGWFDTSCGKPRVQVQRAQGGAWETVGALEDYPATTGSDPGGLKAGTSLHAAPAGPVAAVAIRVIGRPAAGDNPAQAFSSCSGLQAFAD